MVNVDQNEKSLDAEDDDEVHVRRVPVVLLPNQSWRQRICPSHRLVLILLGLLSILTLTIAVLGVTGHTFSSSADRMQADLKSINHTIFEKLATLKKNKTGDLKKVAQLEETLQRLTEEIEKEKTEYQSQVKKLQVIFRTRNCDLEAATRNQTTDSPTVCCPVGWDALGQSCYWVSKTDNSWDEAKADCEAKDSHLAIITSYVEKQFVMQRLKKHYTWIGLTYGAPAGIWKWVDGTTYTVRRSDWKGGEPSLFHGLYGTAAFCTFVQRDGLWSSEYCTRRYNWMCEMETGSSP